MSIVFKPVEIPDFTLWRTKFSSREKLKIVNPSDFPIEKVMKELGLEESSLAESFPITDREEILQRINLLHDLIEQPDVREWIRYNYGAFSYRLPQNEDNFMKFYHPELERNPFYKLLDEFIKETQYSDSPRLQMLRGYFNQLMNLETAENQMGKIISKELERVCEFEGLMRLSVNIEVEEKEKDKKRQKILEVSLDKMTIEHVHGYEKFLFSVLEQAMEKYPSWYSKRWHPFNWFFADKVKKRVDKRNEEKIAKAYEESVFTKLPPEAEKELKEGVFSKLKDLNFTDFPLLHLDFLVQFFYSKEGLHFKLLNVLPTYYKSDAHYSLLSAPNLSGDKYRKQFAQANNELKLVEGLHEKYKLSPKLTALVRKQLPKLFKLTKIKSYHTDTTMRWKALDNLYLLPGHKELYQHLTKHRKKVYDLMLRLNQVRDIADKLEMTARRLQSDISKPHIHNGRQIVSFETIYPLHIGTYNQIVPISKIPELNGQMLALTGDHGGGKSVAGISIIMNVYLMQCGFPIFGKNFHANIKKVLGVVMNDEGEGSTATVMVTKMKNLLQALKKFKASEVLLFIDEIGKGTQAVSGLELGRDVLTTLAKRHASVIFNSQIIELASFAQEKLNAIPLKVNRKHRFTPGIGDGGMNTLRRRVGINKYIEV